MKTLKKAITLTLLFLFLVSSSGVLITVHHCCHAHHHAVGDHHHCHNDYHFFKITDQFNTTETDLTSHSDDIVIVLFSEQLIYFCDTIICSLQIHNKDHFPPPIWWQHISHFIFIAQHRL